MQFILEHELSETASDVEKAARDAAAHNIDALQLILTGSGALDAATSEDAVRALAGLAERGGVPVQCLRLSAGSVSLPSGRDLRAPALATFSHWIERAAWMGATSLILPANIAQLTGPDGSATAARFLEVLLHLRFEAQRCAVRLVLPAPSPFLPSAGDARNTIDRLNSPWVGVAVDTGELPTAEAAGDWIQTLTHRIAEICLTRRTADEWGIHLARAIRFARFAGQISAVDVDSLGAANRWAEPFRTNRKKNVPAG